MLEKGAKMEVICNDVLNFKGWRRGRSKIFFGEKYICRNARLEIGDFREFLMSDERVLNWIDDNLDHARNSPDEMSTGCLAKKIQLDIGVDISPSQLSYVLMQLGYAQTLTKNGLHAYVRAQFSPNVMESYDGHELYGDWQPLGLLPKHGVRPE